MSIRTVAAFASKQLTETEVLGSNLLATNFVRLFIEAPCPPLSLTWLRPVDQQLSTEMFLKGGAACVLIYPVDHNC